MGADVDSLKEQAKNLHDCLERIRSNMEKFPNQREMRWMEQMMESSLVALDQHIRQLEKLGYRGGMHNEMFKR